MSGKSRAVSEVELRLDPIKEDHTRMGSRPLTVYSCYVISLENVLTSPQIMVICTIVKLTVHLLSDCIIHISSPVMYFHALGLYFMLRCTAERNQISRSR